MLVENITCSVFSVYRLNVIKYFYDFLYFLIVDTINMISIVHDFNSMFA